MVYTYDKSSKEFAFTIDERQVLQGEKMNFRNAWPSQEATLCSKRLQIVGRGGKENEKETC